MKAVIACAALLLLCSSALAAPVLSTGVDKKTGRHYVLTLTGKVSKKDLPMVDGMVHAHSDLGAYIVTACASAGASRCEVYAGLDTKRWLPPGYIFAVTKGDQTFYRSDAMNRPDDPPTFACVPPDTPVAPVTGKNVLEGHGPVVLMRDGAGVRVSYNKGYRCKVEIDGHFDLVGSVVFGGK